MSMSLPHARIASVTLSVTALMAVAGCGGGHAAPVGMTVSERDFRITAPEHLRAGRTTLRVVNSGPDTHELIIIRAADARLPLRRDGLTVDEDAVSARTAASYDGLPAGRSRTHQLTLGPGHYLLLCNMAGHFRGGMHTELVVGR